MKNHTCIILFLFVSFGLIASNGAATTNVADGEACLPDSTVSVIGYFCKNDSLEYWINESEWRIEDGDTVQTAGVNTLVRIVVADSLPSGYRMSYTFLDFEADTLVGEDTNGDFQNRLVEILGKKVTGMTIRFETDEYGAITRFDNLDDINRQVTSQYKEVMAELVKQPEIQALKGMGLDLTAMAEELGVDKWTESYLDELKHLFMCHGLVYDVGVSEEHDDATDDQFESDTFQRVAYGDDGTYSISTDVVSVIPPDDLKTLIGVIVDKVDDDVVRESFNNEFDNQVRDNATYDSYFEICYLPDGWPYKVIKQRIMKIADRAKVNQTSINLRSYR